MKDWAQELIRELQQKGLVTDDATREFVKAYANGDSREASEAYSAAAIREQVFEPNTYILRVFADGSCDADWKQGIDRFYPEINDLIVEDEEVAERFKD